MENQIEASEPSNRLGENAAEAFAALGDWTRMLLVVRLVAAGQQGEPCSIEDLSEYVRQQGVRLTRQAVTKHLRQLEHGGLVHSIRQGRERIYQLDPEGIGAMQGFLESVGKYKDKCVRA